MLLFSSKKTAENLLILVNRALKKQDKSLSQLCFVTFPRDLPTAVYSRSVNFTPYRLFSFAAIPWCNRWADVCLGIFSHST